MWLLGILLTSKVILMIALQNDWDQPMNKLYKRDQS